MKMMRAVSMIDRNDVPSTEGLPVITSAAGTTDEALEPLSAR